MTAVSDRMRMSEPTLTEAATLLRSAIGYGMWRPRDGIRRCAWCGSSSKAETFAHKPGCQALQYEAAAKRVEEIDHAAGRLLAHAADWEDAAKVFERIGSDTAHAKAEVYQRLATVVRAALRGFEVAAGETGVAQQAEAAADG